MAAGSGGWLFGADGELDALHTARYGESTRYCKDKPANLALGVMRFLQTEWHRHERDRNAWEIERAEMKSRIAKLEGDGKKSRQTQESLSKHIRMLEMALRKEREKIKGLSNGEEVDMKDAKELAREQLKAAGKGMCFASGLTSVTDSCQGHSWTLSKANQMSIQSTNFHRA